MKKYFYIFIFFIFLISACSKQQNQELQKTIPLIPSNDVFVLNPEEVVILYFQAWNDKKYGIMYSLISDGFKQIEPSAKTLDDFKSYMSKFYDTSSGVEIIEANEAYQSEKEAGVNYKISIINKDGTKREFESAYTLKKRANGWKLIHPYGQNIDTT